ncbi:baeRF12 domain-containing protein [Polynucleobacter sinensis]|jgi:protein required for attachment to host cells|uniref:baeRF12 domain-containing protein n=1 Tax=Polynucleobacter sinensis TaxID=1743157 RepID=UPI0007806EFD|nr:host attachment protein [Polynucleobacter sinensis]
MSAFSSGDLYIVVDGHHFIFLAKDKIPLVDHLIAFKKVDYDPATYATKKRADPGRTFNRIAGARSSYAFAEPSKKSDVNYLREACKTIDEEFKRGKFSRIILIGDFEILAMMKKSMSKNMLTKVFHEIYKNYSKMPIERLERHLRSLEGAH